MSSNVDKPKPLALLIPGLDGTGKFYYRQVGPLSVRSRVLAWEFRRQADFDFADLVEELGEGTAAEEPGTIAVVGESFGGTVAMHYVLAYPERVGRLVLINTFPSYRWKIRISLACRVSALLRWRGMRGVKSFIAERILVHEGILPEDRRRYHEIVSLIDPAAYRRRLELVRDSALRERLGEITAPTLLLASGRDKIVPSVAEARFMASRIPNARLYEFPRAGHALLLTPGFSLAEYI